MSLRSRRNSCNSEHDGLVRIGLDQRLRTDPADIWIGKDDDWEGECLICRETSTLDVGRSARERCGQVTWALQFAGNYLTAAVPDYVVVVIRRSRL